MAKYSVYLESLTKSVSLVALTTALVLAPVASQAGEMVLKGRNVQAKSESNWKQIGSNENHGLGAYESIGLTLLEDGGVATYTNKGTYESNNGIGDHQGYVVRIYPDGSTTTGKYQGQPKPSGKLRVREGTYTYVLGTGRFKAIKGGGSYKGTRYSNGMAVTDYEGKVTLPD